MGTKPYIRLTSDSERLEALMKARITAFGLLTIIAQRAKKPNDNSFDNLEVGEARVGDYESYGVTEKVYRNDKRFLEKHKFATFKGANRGTIAKLTDASIFDIGLGGEGEQRGEQGASKGRTRGEQGASKGRAKGYKKEKKTKVSVKEESSKVRPDYVQEIMDFYNKIYHRNVVSDLSFRENITFWIAVHPMKKIKKAIMQARTWDNFGKDLDISVFFRRKNTRGEPVDYIEAFYTRGFSVQNLSKSEIEYYKSDLENISFWNTKSPNYLNFSDKHLPFVEQVQKKLQQEFESYPDNKKKLYDGLFVNIFE